MNIVRQWANPEPLDQERVDYVDANEHEGILAIFLAEAEEIVQGLFAQLEELQYGYDGQRILDDIHRGFHTLYGGAAVLELVELTECSRLSERVMDRLRTRRMPLSPSLVSLIVGATSAIEAMLNRLINHQSVRPIPEDLRLRLLRAAGQSAKSRPVQVPQAGAGESLLGVFFDGEQAEAAPSAGSEQISDREFENLLDSLYGKGRAPGQGYSDAADNGPAQGASMVAAESKALSADSPAARAGEPQIADLVSELAWVRNRLMGFRREQGGDKLNKALAYLDLVTQDMERWLLREPSRKQR